MSFLLGMIIGSAMAEDTSTVINTTTEVESGAPSGGPLFMELTEFEFDTGDYNEPKLEITNEERVLLDIRHIKKIKERSYTRKVKTGTKEVFNGRKSKTEDVYEEKTIHYSYISLINDSLKVKETYDEIKAMLK